MKFVLHYRGPLRANGRPDHKHEIRRHFHHQIKALFDRQPLSDSPKLLQPRSKPGEYTLRRELEGYTFIPLVTEEMNIVAEVSLLMLRPEPPGKLITQGGDIDNRIKTLFDALTMPRHKDALPSGIMPAELPLFCVFEDDNLITSVTIRTEQLLEPVTESSLVDLVIDIHACPTRHTWGNGAFQ